MPTAARVCEPPALSLCSWVRHWQEDSVLACSDRESSRLGTLRLGFHPLCGGCPVADLLLWGQRGLLQSPLKQLGEDAAGIR